MELLRRGRLRESLANGVLVVTDRPALTCFVSRLSAGGVGVRAALFLTFPILRIPVTAMVMAAVEALAGGAPTAVGFVASPPGWRPLDTCAGHASGGGRALAFLRSYAENCSMVSVSDRGLRHSARSGVIALGAVLSVGILWQGAGATGDPAPGLPDPCVDPTVTPSQARRGAVGTNAPKLRGLPVAPQSAQPTPRMPTGRGMDHGVVPIPDARVTPDPRCARPPQTRQGPTSPGSLAAGGRARPNP